ncbi:MAG: DUF4465 domain-containing protein [Hyphomicrobiales bacterium]
MRKIHYYLSFIILAFAVKSLNAQEVIANGGKVLMPTDTKTVKVSNAIFKDSGDDNPYGTDGGTLTILPTEADKKLTVTFSTWDLNRMEYSGMTMGDDLKIYDGTSSSATLIGAFGDNSPETIEATNAEGALTFVFTSSMGNSSNQGWEATISYIEEDTDPTPDEGYNLQAGVNTKTIDTPIDFYDDGGASGNYTLGFEGIVHFTPKNEGEKIKIVFSEFDIHSVWEDFEIYNGKSTEIEDRIGKYADNPGIIKSTSDDGILTVKFKSFSFSKQKAGWKAKVSAFIPQDIAFVEATAIQNTEKIFRNQSNTNIIAAQLDFAGEKNSTEVQALTFNCEGTTIPANIAKASLYYTAVNNEFKTDTKLGELDINGTDNFTFEINQAIEDEGSHYFWLAFDINGDAITGNKIDATLQSVKIAGTDHTPITKAPEGARIVTDAFNGTHTIGNSDNAEFATIKDAINALDEGIEGNVIFLIEPGTYNEYNTINAIKGASANSTITFKSSTDDYNDVFFVKPGYTSYPLITIDGASYIRFESITFKAEELHKKSLLKIKNAARYNAIKNCKFIAPISTVYTHKISLLLTESNNQENQNNDYNLIEGNIFDGGYNGIDINGIGYVNSIREKGNIVRNNSFYNQGSKAIFISNQNEFILEGNYAENKTTTKTSFQAITGYRIYGKSKIFNNIINLELNNSATGLELRPIDSDSKALVYNNMISIKASRGNCYGIHLNMACKNTNFYHNTINIHGTPTRSASIFIDGAPKDKPKSLVFKNNIFYNSSAQYTVRIKNAEFLEELTFDYNNHYTIGNFSYVAEEEIETFEAFKTRFNSSNSVSKDVFFLDPSNLHIAPDNDLKVGVPIDDITIDIDGDDRDATAPYLGADEVIESIEVAPNFLDGYPKISSIKSTSADLITKTDRAGKAIYLVKPADDPKPTKNNIINEGTSTTFNANIESTVTIESLETESEYKVYMLMVSIKSMPLGDVTSCSFSTKIKPFEVANMENLTLDDESFWNGSDESGFFNSGSVKFYNDYNTTSNSWSSFAYSNITDITTIGIENQYSAYTKHSDITKNKYIIANCNKYSKATNTIEFTNTSKGQTIKGLLVTNSTYAYHSMMNGDQFAKKFGGKAGNDPDFFKLTIIGKDNEGNDKGSVDFYLADYRFEDNSKDYIIDDWTWVDLSSLGEVCGLEFKLSSSDNGDYGMNTPSYFAIDNINGEPFSLKLDEIEDQKINAGESISLSTKARGGYAPYIYSWSPAEGLSATDIANPIANPIKTSVYTITVTDSKGQSTKEEVKINVIGNSQVANFDDLTLETDSHWMGNSVKGDEGVTTYFHSGSYEFYNFHSFDAYTWSGFAYANHSSTDFNELQDQFNCITGKAHSGENYGICYAFNQDPNNKIVFTHTETEDYVYGMYITNNTYAVNSMENGDQFGKVFGGTTGNDPDFFKLIATGIDSEGNETGSAEFYLADYRFEDNTRDYIIKDWEYFDLKALGKVKAVRFHMESSNNDNNGMLTPAYFCFDDFNSFKTDIKETHNTTKVNFYPNPATSFINIVSTDNNGVLEIYSIQGNLMQTQAIDNYKTKVDINQLSKGTYLIKIKSEEQIKTSTLIIQ